MKNATTNNPNLWNINQISQYENESPTISTKNIYIQMKVSNPEWAKWTCKSWIILIFPLFSNEKQLNNNNVDGIYSCIQGQPNKQDK